MQGEYLPPQCDFILVQTISNVAHFNQILELEKVKKYDPTKKLIFPLNGLENRPYSWGSFSRDPGPEFPGNGNAKNPGIPGNFPSRDSRPTALSMSIKC